MPITREVIVTGGRDYMGYTKVWKVLDFLKPDLVIQGGATGADQLAREWAYGERVRYITVPADWALEGRKAGPIRNKRMLEQFQNAIIVAFPGGRGTANCVLQAQKMNRIIMNIG